MADLQKYFDTFHDRIAQRREHEKAVLAEKRKRILTRLADGIAAQRKDGASIPKYRTINQGSYPMGTGVKPLDGDYDLDVAVLFEMTSAKCPDPVAAKLWVHKAIDGHTKEVRVREPCVTVFYQQQGEPVYHLDFAIYAENGAVPQLARGKIGSAPPAKRWEDSDPQGLLKFASDRFAHLDDDGQCRRIIRATKRWKDVNFPREGHAAPRGIALTAAALKWFVPCVARDPVANTTRPDDAKALRNFAERLLSEFRQTPSGPRLQVHLPVAPGNDLFSKMTDAQMTVFHGHLTKLRDGMTSAIDDPDPVTAASKVAKVLGDDFPVPEKSETAVPRGPAIISSGHSA